MKTDIRRFCVVAKRAGVTVGSLIVTGQNNVPAAKATLAFTHLGSDSIVETQIGAALRLVWTAPRDEKQASGGES